MSVTFMTNEDRDELNTKIRNISKENTAIEQIDYDAYTGNLLLASGNTKTSDNKITSDAIPAKEGDVYLITCSANWNNPIYVVYDLNGSVIASELSPSTSDGIVVTDYEIVMPENTSYFRIGCNLTIQPDGHNVKKKKAIAIIVGAGRN